MIDVTFLLLVYFMVSTVLALPEDQLTSSIQTRDADASGMQADFQPQIVEVLRLDGAPAYRLAGQTFVDPNALVSVLSELPRDIGIFIRVHPDVPVGFALAAVQSATDAGFEQVTYVPED
ncbi:MAG: biopolymer transporter ExbD [Phycisphaerales bacterium]|nr:biopolymer transporter ExbD [Phycisphaerales bacterium]